MVPGRYPRFARSSRRTSPSGSGRWPRRLRRPSNVPPPRSRRSSRRSMRSRRVCDRGPSGGVRDRGPIQIVCHETTPLERRRLMDSHGGPHPGSKLLPRVLGPAEAFCVVVGSVIGSGIFLVPASVARDVPFVGGIILVWIVGGIFSAAGALALPQLGAMMPHAGGPYVYLRAAYGRIPAFLFGWAEYTVVRTGSMATLAAAFARYFVQLVPPPSAIDGRVWQAAAAVIAISVVTAVNV